MGRLDGKVAVITGGSSGIGRATALALSAEGAAVAIGGRNASALEEAQGAITAKGGRALSQVMDVRDEGQEAVHTGGVLLHQPGAKEELMVGRLGLGGRLAERARKELGETHRKLARSIRAGHRGGQETALVSTSRRRPPSASAPDGERRDERHQR